MSKKTTSRSHTGMNTVTSCISTTLVLLLMGTVVFFVTVADKLSDSLRENFTVSLLLDDDMPASETGSMKARLASLTCTREVTYISKEQAEREQAEAMGSDPAEFLGTSPIPASFELHLKADYASSDSLARFLPQLKKEKYVTEIAYPEELMDSINRNIRKASFVLLILAVLLTFVSFELINNTIRLSVYSRRFLIYTMKLVGAKWSFIRRPFMARAFWIGVLSGLLADGLLGAGIYALLDFEPQMRPILTPDVWILTLGTVFVTGILLTLLCAWFSVGTYLKAKAHKLYTM